jgi:hypothetical protein
MLMISYNDFVEMSWYDIMILSKCLDIISWLFGSSWYDIMLNVNNIISNNDKSE